MAGFSPVTNSKFSKGASFLMAFVFVHDFFFRQYGTRHGVADMETAIHARVGAGIRDVKRHEHGDGFPNRASVYFLLNRAIVSR